MSSVCLKFLGVALCVAGTLLLVIVCVLPMWTVTAITERTIVTSVRFWHGLWMSCAASTAGERRCAHYDDLHSMGHHMHAQRALVVIAVVLSSAALSVTVAGAQHTNCVGDESTKARLVRAGGVLHVASAVVVFVPLCWVAVAVTRDFHDHTFQKKEIGAAIYIGWAAAALLLLGGTLLCCSSGCLRLKSSYPIRYVRSSD
ncbi:hypothetical protein CRUP_026097 [Coryphaenoides rupestris]|nr:hypothetical protein CRUP_026097 [Coryphaenoides rupestris]